MSRPVDRPSWSPPRPSAAGRITYQPRPPAPPGLPAPPRLIAPAVAALLAGDERAPFDAAAHDRVRPLHLDTLDALAAAVHAGNPVGAVVVSVRALARAAAAGPAGPTGPTGWAAPLADLVRAHPAVPMLGLVSDDVPLATGFALGRCGLRGLVDVRAPDGWTLLRHALGSTARSEVSQLAADRLAPHLAGRSDDVRRFVAALFAAPPRLNTVRDLGRALGLLPTTLMSRFFRADLPAPRRYLALARLARAADLLAYGGWTVATVADYMDYSSAQGFSRHLYLVLGVRPSEFRRRYTPEMLLDRFAEELLTPYPDALRDLRIFHRPGEGR